MPSRKVPNTDAGRLQALETAAGKAVVVAPRELAFSAESKTALDTTLPLFRTEMQERGVAAGAQVAATAALTDQRTRLRLFASHFLQNLTFAIERGVFQASDRAFYQLPASQESLPPMSKEADLLMWTQRIVDGEAARTAAGGTAMPFPSAAEVEAERAAYVTLQGDQTTKIDALNSEQEDVEAMRDDVDDLVLDIWDEVEFTFRKDSPPSLRAKAREYGVVYISRPGEPSDPGDPGGPGDPTPPDAPAAPTLTPAAPGDVNVEWNAIDDATEYRVEKEEVGVDAGFVEFTTLNSLTVAITGLTSGNTLRVRIIALNASAESPPSAVSEILVP